MSSAACQPTNEELAATELPVSDRPMGAKQPFCYLVLSQPQSHCFQSVLLISSLASLIHSYVTLFYALVNFCDPSPELAACRHDHLNRPFICFPERFLELSFASLNSHSHFGPAQFSLLNSLPFPLKVFGEEIGRSNTPEEDSGFFLTNYRLALLEHSHWRRF
ncbi:unnamed protein product [Protopolystoma xenopodis]|uniref:Uncharacterized protein n=1 Tax=Protopolystoma xenopodis TaxID=117903 RepID=A0A3S5ADR8_9PLAT|nr:unnamed protein product [Protopolystoma xenopodis]